MRRTTRTITARDRGPNRRGLVLLVVMVCLLLVGVVGGSALKCALWQSRQMQQEVLRCQADWLAEAAFERASAQLRQNWDYTGETWDVSTEELGTPHAALIAISVEPAAEGASRRSVAVVVDYPHEGPSRTRVSRKLWVDQAK